MADYSNITGGLRIPAQIPLDVKTYSESELILSDLGAFNNLAFTYYEGLKVFCNQEQSTWIWSEVPDGKENTGLLSTDFIYPSGIISFGIDYSNKKFNFFKEKQSNNVYKGSSPTTITVGGLNAGTNIFEQSYDTIIQSIVAPFILPTFNSFNISDQSQTVESGSVISGNKDFVFTFNKIENVKPNSLEILYNTVSLISETSVLTSPVNVNIPLINIVGNNVQYVFNAKAKINNVNETVFLAQPFVITSRYKQFFGNVANFPTNSATVRALSSNNFANINNWITPIVNTNRFSISIPASKTLISVITSNFENITSNFTISVFNVNDFAGNPISYKTYNYVSALPINLTFTITTS